MKKIKAILAAAIGAAALCLLGVPAHADRPTWLVGSAEEVAFTGWSWTWSPWCQVTILDAYGDWWQTKTFINCAWSCQVPSNRTYWVWAQSTSWPYYRSWPVCVWAPERPWYLPNATALPGLICDH